MRQSIIEINIIEIDIKELGAIILNYAGNIIVSLTKVVVVLLYMCMLQYICNILFCNSLKLLSLHGEYIPNL